MPSSIASLASGGGASAAAVASTSETNISDDPAAVRAQQRDEPAQLAAAAGRRAPAPDQIVATRAHSPATRLDRIAVQEDLVRQALGRDLRVQRRLGQQLLVRAARQRRARSRARRCRRPARSSRAGGRSRTSCRPRMTSRSAALISRSVVASTDEVASSRIRMRGSARKARAIAIRWRWPPRKRQAALADAGVVAVRQLGDEPRRLRALGGAARSPRARRPAARRRCCPRPCRRTGTGRRRRPRSRCRSDDDVDRAHVGAVDQHRARARVVQPRQQLHQRRLAGARWRRPARPCCRPRRPGRRRAARPGRRRSRTSRRAARRARGPRAATSAPPTIRGSRSRISSSRAPDAVARCARPSATPSIRIGPISISRYV